MKHNTESEACQTKLKEYWKNLKNDPTRNTDDSNMDYLKELNTLIDHFYDKSKFNPKNNVFQSIESLTRKYQEYVKNTKNITLEKIVIFVYVALFKKDYLSTVIFLNNHGVNSKKVEKILRGFYQ